MYREVDGGQHHEEGRQARLVQAVESLVLAHLVCSTTSLSVSVVVVVVVL